MTAQDILIVAQFMHEGSRVEGEMFYYSNGWDEHWSQFPYNNSWLRLMPVVEKIEALGYRVEIYHTQCTIYSEGREIYIKSPTKIEAVFNACVEFIKQHSTKTHE